MKCWPGLNKLECSYVKPIGGYVKPSSGLESGWSTRYWDCSKPTCAWEHGAKACAQDGFTPANVGDASGATGGTAYVCSNQQPFAVDQGLSYGFVAVSDAQLCCACFELTFTDTAVAGKKMVVQVTNTGPEERDHFDIAMPGGGIGGTDGCTPQFGKNVHWGRNGGGIYNRDECYGLPQPLWPGCLWRFDWFQDADNPRFTYAPVQCPAALGDVSGC